MFRSRFVRVSFVLIVDLGAAPAAADLGEDPHDREVLAVVELVALRLPLCQTVVDGLGLV